MRVGFVGIAKRGGRLAARLVAGGFDVVAHDRDETGAAPLLALGATWAASPA